MLPGCFFLYAQNSDLDDSIAVLEEGPVKGFEIPEIGENVIPYYKGKYTFSGSSIEVFYTVEDIIVFSEWEIISAGSYRFYNVSDNMICFINSGKWTLFIKTENRTDDFYSFASELVKKMLFFAKTEDFFKLSSFPAIININR